MITISNLWGMFFCFGIPTIAMIFLSYYAGIEEAEERQKKRVAQRQL